MYSVALPQPKIRDGAYFYDLLNSFTTSHLTTATIDDKRKLVFPESTFSIGAVTNSYKYGQELQFIGWSRSPPIKTKRVDKEHGYFRIESYLELTHETADMLRGVADKIDAILGYSYYIHTEPYRGPKKVITGESGLEEML